MRRPGQERGHAGGEDFELHALTLALLIPTVLWGVVAALLARTGRKALRASTPPAPQTVETVKEDIQWAKTQTGSAKT